MRVSANPTYVMSFQVAIDSIRLSGISFVGDLDEFLKLDLVRLVECSDFSLVENLILEEIRTRTVRRTSD